MKEYAGEVSVVLINEGKMPPEDRISVVVSFAYSKQDNKIWPIPQKNNEINKIQTWNS